MNTSPTDYQPMEELALQRFNGERFEVFGELLSARVNYAGSIAIVRGYWQIAGRRFVPLRRAGEPAARLEPICLGALTTRTSWRSRSGPSSPATGSRQSSAAAGSASPIARTTPS